MMVLSEPVDIALNAWGGGTIVSRPLSGKVAEIRVPNAGAAWVSAGATDIVVTRLADGGTVVALTDVSAPISVRPAPVYHTASGAVAGTATVPGVVVDDHLRVVVTDGVASGEGVLFVHVAGG